ncbi:hypothetical protein ACS127_13255 [Amphibacillus sp. Q70]|uniref:hypothetical protein n=1 Tax=Amphibacillus sp. Q70 TaxID=3453416 RepID=UPI003F85D3AF
MWIPINTLIILMLFGGIIWLQFYLSKQDNKWLGLILPIISLVFSIIIILNIIASNMTEFLTTAIPTFLMSNFPTLILLAIYFSMRKKLKSRNELDKMNVQDLN